jgi:hypothetical protein
MVDHRELLPHWKPTFPNIYLQIVQKFASWAAILTVPTMVAGFYG